jgi:hypothetical protein
MEGQVPDEPDLTRLEAERARLYGELAGVGDFRRGTLCPVFRKCGKPNCRCAQPGERGHGPQWNWVRWAGGKTVTTHPRPGPELDKARREAGEWERFKALTGQIEAVNEAICDARPPLAEPGEAAPGTQGQKRGSSAGSSPRRSRPRPPRR